MCVWGGLQFLVLRKEMHGCAVYRLLLDTTKEAKNQTQTKEKEIIGKEMLC